MGKDTKQAGKWTFTVRAAADRRDRVERARKADNDRHLNSWVTAAIDEKLARAERKAAP